jgi:hypothetical protein
MIKLGFDDFFTFSDQTTKSYAEMNLSVDDKKVIPHPLFPFRTHNGSQIYHTLIRTSSEDMSIFDFFLSKFSESAGSSVDDLWDNTGFWTMSDSEHDYVGIGLDSLSKTMSEKLRGRFSCCLARIDIIIVFSSKFEYAILKDAELDIYVTDPLLYSGKAAQSLKEAFLEIGGHRVVEEALISNNLCSHAYESRVRIRKPEAVVKGIYGFPVMAVLTNPFFGKGNISIQSLRHFLGQGKCGFAESDFDGKLEFSAELDLWQLKSVIVGNLLFGPR